MSSRRNSPGASARRSAPSGGRSHRHRTLVRPTRWHLGVALGLAASAALALWWLLQLDGLLSWLAGINLATAALYVYDKAIAGSRRVRVPERALLVLALVGGTPAAYASMRLVHHKTAKQGFQRRFWLIVAGQILVMAAYFFLIRPRVAGAA